MKNLSKQIIFVILITCFSLCFTTNAWCGRGESDIVSDMVKASRSNTELRELYVEAIMKNLVSWRILQLFLNAPGIQKADVGYVYAYIKQTEGRFVISYLENTGAYYVRDQQVDVRLIELDFHNQATRGELFDEAAVLQEDVQEDDGEIDFGSFSDSDGDGDGDDDRDDTENSSFVGVKTVDVDVSESSV